MFLSLHSKNLNAKIKEINVLLNFFAYVQYASLWLHGTHQNGIPFLAKLEQAYRDRCLSRPQLSESSDHPLTTDNVDQVFYIAPVEKVTWS